MTLDAGYLGVSAPSFFDAFHIAVRVKISPSAGVRRFS